MQQLCSRIGVCLGFIALLYVSPAAFGQGAPPAGTNGAKEEAPAKLIEIPDEPKTIDPATLVPPKLAQLVTIDFVEKSLKDVVEWIETEQKIEVMLDQKALQEAGILASEQVSDHLENYPLYLLLNRLSSLGLAWYMEDDILHITTIKVAQQHQTTSPYNVGDLFDAGYKPGELTATIKSTGVWHSGGQEGGEIVLLGDVLFVRQTGPMHREVAGLLAALRKHGRQTFTLDPPQHAILRQKLEQNVNVKFQDLPLTNAIQELSQLAGIDIRLDLSSLKEAGVRDRVPVTLTLSDQKLTTVLQALLMDLNLRWILRDGILWITSVKEAENFTKTAVFNVADLCVDIKESQALMWAIKSQTPGPWNSAGNSISFARSDVMVVRQTERGLAEVLQLLENYRTALRNSKRRQREGEGPQEVLTRYYRVPTIVANELPALLQTEVKPESWQDANRPQAVGTISKIASTPSVLQAENIDAESSSHPPIYLIPNSVLIIRQTRENHYKIRDLIRQIEEGDAVLEEASDMGVMGGGMGGMGGGMGGGGGFGGGFFSITDPQPKVAPQPK